jgi:hypothetical protein
MWSTFSTFSHVYGTSDPNLCINIPHMFLHLEQTPPTYEINTCGGRRPHFCTSLGACACAHRPSAPTPTKIFFKKILLCYLYTLLGARTAETRRQSSVRHRRRRTAAEVQAQAQARSTQCSPVRGRGGRTYGIRRTRADGLIMKRRPAAQPAALLSQSSSEEPTLRRVERHAQSCSPRRTTVHAHAIRRAGCQARARPRLEAR